MTDQRAMRDDVGNRDRRVLDVFVMLIIMLGPMQAYLLVRLVDCPLAATFNALLVSRCCQMLVLGAARYLTLHADYKGCLLYTSPSPRDRG